MNVIMIESAAFQELIGHIEKIAEHIRKYEDRQPVQPQERWLTSKEVTALLGISLRTLQRYRSVGALPYKTLGKKTYYSEEDVLEFLSNHVKEFKKEDIAFYKARIHNFFHK